jgi:hypothetical protein
MKSCTTGQLQSTLELVGSEAVFIPSFHTVILPTITDNNNKGWHSSHFGGWEVIWHFLMHPVSQLPKGWIVYF